MPSLWGFKIWLAVVLNHQFLFCYCGSLHVASSAASEKRQRCEEENQSHQALWSFASAPIPAIAKATSHCFRLVPLTVTCRAAAANPANVVFQFLIMLLLLAPEARTSDLLPAQRYAIRNILSRLFKKMTHR